MTVLPGVAWMGDVVRPFAQCGVSLADRGLLFGESVYEVIPITAGRVRMLAEHVERMRSGAGALGVERGVPRLEAWGARIAELIELEGLSEGIVYAQLTGGTADRAHVTEAPVEPTFFAWLRPLRFPRANRVEVGLSTITAPDIRWARGEIKSTMLLPSVLGKRRARATGADEVIFTADGQVREGGSTSVFIVEGGELVTGPPAPMILPGLTAELVASLARSRKMTLRREAISVERLRGADEVFVTSTTLLAMPVLRVDDGAIGEGIAGPIARQLAADMRAFFELEDE